MVHLRKNLKNEVNLEEIQYPDVPCIVYLPTKLAHKNGVNVGKYSIHGAYGYIDSCLFRKRRTKKKRVSQVMRVHGMF